MENSFIAYFDILGYKDAILNTEASEFSHRVDHIMRDIERSLSLEKLIKDRRGFLIGDQQTFTTNVHFISDTILFWPKSDLKEDVERWFLVSQRFASIMNLQNMPIRGCLYYGQFEWENWHKTMDSGSGFTVATIYGRALVNAHNKAEQQSWAGTVIDDTAISKLNLILGFSMDRYCTKEIVPYKSSRENSEHEVVFKLYNVEEKIGEVEFYEYGITRSFQNDNRDFSSKRVQEIYTNTIELLKNQLATEHRNE